MEGPGTVGPAALHSQVLMALTDAVVVTDLSRRIVECNPAAEAMFNSSREVMLGQTPQEMGATRSPTLSADFIADTVRSTGSWSGDVLLPGDCDRVGATVVFPVLDESGATVGFAGITRDVTAERHTATRLARAEQLWRSMLDVAPTGLALVSLAGRFERVNTALCRIVGYAAEELIRMTFQQITHPDDLASDLALLTRLLAGEIEHYTLEKRYLHSGGHLVWVQLSVALIRDPGTAQADQFVVAVENVTARRLAGERLSAIIAGASDALIGIAPAGYVTEWNTAAERLFGWTHAEVLGRSLETLIVPPEQREAHRQGLDRLRQGGTGRILNRPVELVALTKNNDLMPVELTVWRADGAGGEFYAFVRDTTERTQAAHRQSAIAAAQLAIADVELSPQKVMQEICVHAQALTGAGGACVAVVEGSDLVYRAATGSAETNRGHRFRLESSLSALAVATGHTLICHDSETDPRVDLQACRLSKVRSMVVVPLRRGTHIHGVINVISERAHQFNDDDCSTLTLLAAPFGAALANAWRLEATAQEAVTDALTGLGNRAHGLRELDRALLRQGRRGSGHTAVIFIDLDRFKQVNDTFGHTTGDQVLTAVADKLRLTLRSTDTCARYGGDEFLVLCEGVVSPGDIAVLAERLITLIAGSYPTAGPGTTDHPEIGISIGIAVTAAHRSATDLLQAADEAMYEAKNRGGNTYTIRQL